MANAINAIHKSKRALHTIKLINRYFTNIEVRQLITSNYYSILCYNSEIWHIITLNTYSKRQLLSASAVALKLCTPGNASLISYNQLHLLNKRAPPEQYLLYKHALQLHRVLNNTEPIYNWTVLNLTQSLTSRQTKFMAIKTNNFKVGFNYHLGYLICYKEN